LQRFYATKSLRTDDKLLQYTNCKHDALEQRCEERTNRA